MTNIEIIWQTFVAAVDQMRQAQKRAENCNVLDRIEAYENRIKHEQIVDGMIADVTRKSIKP
jgi:hypothetical protein